MLCKAKNGLGYTGETLKLAFGFMYRSSAPLLVPDSILGAIRPEYAIWDKSFICLYVSLTFALGLTLAVREVRDSYRKKHAGSEAPA